jgi:hypothetical protein
MPGENVGQQISLKYRHIIAIQDSEKPKSIGLGNPEIFGSKKIKVDTMRITS